MLIRCPFCGERPVEEFHFHRVVDGPDGSPMERVYLRNNHRGLSEELWQHVSGCRSWLRITRNPSTNEVLRVQFLEGSS